MTTTRHLENAIIKCMSQTHQSRQNDNLQLKRSSLYDDLNAIVKPLNLDVQKGACRAHQAVAHFPILNPLAITYRWIAACDAGMDARYHQELIRLYGGAGEDQSDLRSTYTNFQHCTGKPLQAYTKAYERSGNSVFSKVSKQLKKQRLSWLPDEEVLIYLAHPFLRYEAREQYLRGKHLPLLEVDILSQWAKRRAIDLDNLSENTPSFARRSEGERDASGQLLSVSPDGKLLNRQQWLDTHRALLPDVLQSLREESIAAKDESEIARKMQYEKRWENMLALFAVASLCDDVAIMGMGEGLDPAVANLLAEMHVMPPTTADELGRDDDLDSIFETHRFHLENLNGGFYPASPELADAILAQADQDETGASPSPMPRLISSFQDVETITRVGTLISNPLDLLMADTGAPYFSHSDQYPRERHQGHDIRKALSDAGEAWENVRNQRLVMLSYWQRQHLALNATMPVPKEKGRLFYEVVDHDATSGFPQALALDMAVNTFRHYVTTPNTEELVNSVCRLLETVCDRSKRVMTIGGQHGTPYVHGLDIGNAPLDEDEDSGKSTMTVHIYLSRDMAKKVEGKSVYELSDHEIDAMASDARDAANKLRYVSTMMAFAAHHTYLHGSKLEKDVADAATSMQEPGSGGGNAFNAIEAKMAKLDQARERYRKWAESTAHKINAILEDKAAYIEFPLESYTFQWHEDATAESGREAEVDDSATDDVISLDVYHEAMEEAAEALEKTKANWHAERAEWTQERSELLDLSVAQQDEITEVKEQLAVAEHQARALNHHLSQAERSKMQGGEMIDTSMQAALTEALICYAESPKPETALAIAQKLHGDRLVILPSAFESARDAGNELNGQNLLRRLLILASEGHDILKAGKPLYELNNVMPGDIALNESDSNLQIPKLRQQRTFKETLADGSTQEWLMECHSWIDFTHRMYFDFDAEREAFVIGHAGRHLEVSSIS